MQWAKWWTEHYRAANGGQACLDSGDAKYVVCHGPCSQGVTMGESAMVHRQELACPSSCASSVTSANWLPPARFIFLVWKKRMGKTVLFTTFHRTNYIDTSKALKQHPASTRHSLNIVKRMSEEDRQGAKYNSVLAQLQKAHTSRCEWNFPEWCSVVVLSTSMSVLNNKKLKFKCIHS